MRPTPALGSVYRSQGKGNEAIMQDCIRLGFYPLLVEGIGALGLVQNQGYQESCQNDGEGLE